MLEGETERVRMLFEFSKAMESMLRQREGLD